jgi:N-acetylmuramoyl-L-alanine amidase
VRRLAAILLLLALGATLPAASTDYFLGESVRQLGLRDAGRLAGDGKSSERYATRGGLGFYAEYSRDHIIVDGIKIMLDDAVGSQRGHLTISKRDYDKVFVPLFWESPRGPVRRVLVDPGHGGKDTGKVNGIQKYNEKAATLDTAARLKLLLEKQGIEVFFTRNTDVFVDLEDRPALASKLRADLFISLHYNAGPAGDSTADGVETYCLTPAGQRSTNAGKAKSTTAVEPGNRFDGSNLFLAWSIQRRMIRTTGADDRGVRRARFSVLRTLSCPGVLIEGGFMSSRREGALIAQAAYRQKIAEAVAAGVADYVARIRPPAKATK